MDGELNDVEMWKEKVQQDISELKNNQVQMKNEQSDIKEDIHQLKLSDRLQDQEIKTLKEALFEIKEDTQWIRRKITGAIITAAITAVVGGVIGIAVANIFRG